jgi:MoxR-like ATPase
MSIDERALQELSALMTDVNVSAPSVSKFKPLAEWVAHRVGLEPSQVAAYYVSKPGNFDVRFRQPGVLKNRPLLGVGLFPSRQVAEQSLLPARRSVAESGIFRAMAFCVRQEDGSWRIGPVISWPDPGFEEGLQNLIGSKEIERVAPVAEPPQGDDHASGPLTGGRNAAAEPYDLQRFTEETNIDEQTAKEWLERLRRKGQLVLQGPPGSGKTFVAARLARLFADGTGGIVDTVQFHASWSYEDFIAGLAPVVTPGGALSYEIRPGRFLDFCEMAAEAPDSNSVLVVDEFNRADVARVFGELLHMLEYRGKSVRLSNGPEDGRFAVPGNVYLIATMNTADRSLALVDHALRRRFSFVRLLPDHRILEQRLISDGINPSPLLALLRQLDEDIADPDYLVGISFFMQDGRELPARMRSIWEGEVLPYVRELFHGDPAKRQRYEWDRVRAEWLSPWYPAPAG